MIAHMGSRQLTIELHRSVERIRETVSGVFQGRSWSRVVKGSRGGTVDIYIDVDKLLAELGPKALRAKSGKSQARSGAIVVKVRHGSITTTIVDPSLPDNEVIKDVVPDPPPRPSAIRIASSLIDTE